MVGGGWIWWRQDGERKFGVGWRRMEVAGGHGDRMFGGRCVGCVLVLLCFLLVIVGGGGGGWCFLFCVFLLFRVEQSLRWFS